MRLSSVFSAESPWSTLSQVQRHHHFLCLLIASYHCQQLNGSYLSNESLGNLLEEWVSKIMAFINDKEIHMVCLVSTRGRWVSNSLTQGIHGVQNSPHSVRLFTKNILKKWGCSVAILRLWNAPKPHLLCDTYWSRKIQWWLAVWISNLVEPPADSDE